MPPAWSAALAQLISPEGPNPQLESDEQLVAAAIATARAVPQPRKPFVELTSALLRAAADDRLAAQPRLDAMAAVPGGMPVVTDSQFNLLIASLLPDKTVELRASAADAIAQSQLTADQLNRLTDTIKSVGPLELDRLLTPFEKSTNERVGLKLIAALQQSLALTSLRIDSLQQRLGKYGPTVQQGVTQLTALVNVEAAQQKQRIDELLPQTSSGDIRRGQSVFNSTKSACTACHRFGYLGGSSGPDLTRIGAIRSERDLLEAILYPSLSFVRSYEPVIVVTADGRIVSGLVRDESVTELTVVTGPNQETKLARSEIEEIRPGTVSVMPAGLDKQLSTQELADLVAFLKNAK
jgi:putative heme-binding domain-containing protein